MKAITASVPNQLNNVVPKGLQDYIKTEIDEIASSGGKNWFQMESSLSSGKKMSTSVWICQSSALQGDFCRICIVERET